MSLLRCEELSIRFGGVQALQDVSVEVGEWEVTGLIGPNGAGKTTLFNCISGFHRPDRGRVLLGGRDITGLPPHRRAALGLGRSFQQAGLVRSLTVAENLLLAQHQRVGYPAVAGMLARPAVAAEEAVLQCNADELLEFLDLARLRDVRLSELPYGTLRIVELAQVLATDPGVLLLDEPSSGLGPAETERLGDVIVRLRDELRLTIFLIEHHVPLVARVCDHVYVLNFGRLLAEGDPATIQRHPEVVAAYLGDDGGRRVPRPPTAAARTGRPLLQVRGVCAGYGSLPVLHDVDLDVGEGETAVVMGLNGAGKTTLLGTIAGVLPVTSGDVVYDGTPLGRLSAPGRVARGVCMVPEGRHVFGSLSVEQNLLLGAWTSREKEEEALREVYALFPALEDRRRQPAGTLSGGEQQMLALGRGLMSRPRLLLIDEASLGLAPVVVAELFARVRRIAETGVTVLLVEQNAAVLNVVDRAFVMEKGRIVFAGSGAELMRGRQLRTTFLGAPDVAAGGRVAQPAGRQTRQASRPRERASTTATSSGSRSPRTSRQTGR